MREIKVRNWMIQVEDKKSSVIGGWLVYEGKSIPSWGGGMRFIIDNNSIRYDWPEVVPAYVKNRLESLKKRAFRTLRDMY